MSTGCVAFTTAVHGQFKSGYHYSVIKGRICCKGIFSNSLNTARLPFDHNLLHMLTGQLCLLTNAADVPRWGLPFAQLGTYLPSRVSASHRPQYA